jgi:dTDP-4-dehydrorhamnose 3,5-epimerase
MKFIQVPFEGAYIVETEPFLDERGLFARTFCMNEFKKIGFDKQIVQINHSVTYIKGTIRGMHYQNPPACEIKIVRCVQGTVFDVMVDLRIGSPTFMRWHGVELSEDNMHSLYIPEGFAHGFQTLTDRVALIYLHSEFYQPDLEKGLRYNDPTLAIKWPLPMAVISDRDCEYPFIDDRFRGIKI